MGSLSKDWWYYCDWCWKSSFGAEELWDVDAWGGPGLGFITDSIGARAAIQPARNLVVDFVGARAAIRPAR